MPYADVSSNLSQAYHVMNSTYFLHQAPLDHVPRADVGSNISQADYVTNNTCSALHQTPSFGLAMDGETSFTTDNDSYDSFIDDIIQDTEDQLPLTLAPSLYTEFEDAKQCLLTKAKTCAVSSVVLQIAYAMEMGSAGKDPCDRVFSISVIDIKFDDVEPYSLMSS